jgi:hypothetical protein
MDKFINTSQRFFIHSIFYQLATKREIYYLQYNLLNKSTDGATVQRPKKNFFSSAFKNIKLPFSLKVLKVIKMSSFYVSNFLFSLVLHRP